MRRSAMTTATTRRWLVWIPVLMVASLLYWTVALGLGGMSLMAVSALSGGAEGVGAGLDPSSPGNDPDNAEANAEASSGVTLSRDGYEPIVVRLEESDEPEDVDDNPGCGLSRGASSPGGAAGEVGAEAAGAPDEPPSPGSIRSGSAIY